MGADKVGAKKSMGEANAEYKKGNYEAALKHYDKERLELRLKAVELDPGEVIYPANRANVYLKMKRWQEAEDDCTAALQINPKYAKALDRRGQSRIEQKKYKEALADFEEAKKIDPKTGSVDKNISLAKAGMTEGSKEVDKAGAKKAMGEANAEYKKGNYEGAVEHYTKAMALDPGEDMYPANRANVYLKMKKWEEAETDCTEAVKLDPKASKAFDRRGQARLELKKYKEALEDFEEAKKLEPKTANIDSNIEKAKEKLKEEENNDEKDDKKSTENEETKKEEDKAEEPKDTESQEADTKKEEGFTKSDAELLQDIESIQAELERRMNNKEKKFAEKELEVERDELEKERKMLIEEKFKFEEIMKEFFEEESKRELEDTDTESDSEDNNNNTIGIKTPSTARSRKHSPDDFIVEEKIPVKATRWHPQVGKAPGPNLSKVRSEIDNKNMKYQPKSARVEIFHDKDYMKKIKEAKRLGVERSARQPRTPTQKSARKDDRPRSLVLQKVEQDDGGSYVRNKSHHRGRSNHKSDPMVEDRIMLEDARKAVVKERLELELLRRQLERKKREAEFASEGTLVSIDPFKDEELYKPKKQIYKTQFELDFENKWREKFGESYHGGL